MKKTDILDKSFNFSLEVIKLYNKLRADKEYILEIKSIINITTAIVKTTQKSLNDK